LTSKRLWGRENRLVAFFWRRDVQRTKSTAQLSTFFSTDAMGIRTGIF
jgi:hypothetical protein